MKSAVAIFVFFLAAVALARPGDHYTDRYDNMDLEEVLGNKALFNAYYKCVMDQGKCTPDGKELKANMKEAMENDCNKCTDVQKSGSKRVLKHMIDNEPEYWNALTAKYDPENKYAGKYMAELRGAK